MMRLWEIQPLKHHTPISHQALHEGSNHKDKRIQRLHLAVNSNDNNNKCSSKTKIHMLCRRIWMTIPKLFCRRVMEALAANTTSRRSNAVAWVCSPNKCHHWWAQPTLVPFGQALSTVFSWGQLTRKSLEHVVCKWISTLTILARLRQGGVIIQPPPSCCTSLRASLSISSSRRNLMTSTLTIRMIMRFMGAWPALCTSVRGADVPWYSELSWELSVALATDICGATSSSTQRTERALANDKTKGRNLNT